MRALDSNSHSRDQKDAVDRLLSGGRSCGWEDDVGAGDGAEGAGVVVDVVLHFLFFSFSSSLGESRDGVAVVVGCDVHGAWEGERRSGAIVVEILFCGGADDAGAAWDAGCVESGR